MGYLGHYLTAFGATMAFIVALKRPAHAIGLVDLPGGRKTHEHPIPLVGGLGMLLGFSVALALLWPLPLHLYGGLLAGMAFLAVVGVIDDRMEISARHRFIAQGLAALIMVGVSGIQVSSLGNLFGLGDLILGYAAIPVTVVCVVALVNAINMTDGFDGLAGSLVLVSLAGLAAIAVIAGMGEGIVPVLLALAACVAGFLVFNLRGPWRTKATVFMGDSGSMLLGFALAWAGAYILQSPVADISAIAIAWVFAMPVFDTSSVMVLRGRRGHNLTDPARDHIHHVLLNAGLSTAAVVSILSLAALVCAAIGIIGWQLGLPDWLMFSGYAAAWAVHLWVMFRGAKHLS